MGPGIVFAFGCSVQRLDDFFSMFMFDTAEIALSHITFDSICATFATDAWGFDGVRPRIFCTGISLAKSSITQETFEDAVAASSGDQSLFGLRVGVRVVCVSLSQSLAASCSGTVISTPDVSHIAPEVRACSVVVS